MSEQVDFNVGWLNDLNRAEKLLDDLRYEAMKTDGYGSDKYNALGRASVEITLEVREQRERLSRRCDPWFDVRQLPRYQLDADAEYQRWLDRMRQGAHEGT